MSLPARLELAAVLVYAAVFALLLAYGRPGLGIGGCFYVAIALAALARGPLVGAAAGGLAVTLYETAFLLTGHTSWASLADGPLEIRLASNMLAGAVIGYFSSRGRRMLSESLHVLEDLLVLARRDVGTGALNAHGLNAAVADRVAHNVPFALLVGEVTDGRKHVIDEQLLRRVTRTLGDETVGDGEVARVGPSQFALVVSARSVADARDAAVSLERALATMECHATFGWAVHPHEGDDTLPLFRSASERLYARRIARGEWSPTAAVVELKPG